MNFYDLIGNLALYDSILPSQKRGPSSYESHIPIVHGPRRDNKSDEQRREGTDFGLKFNWFYTTRTGRRRTDRPLNGTARTKK